MFSGNFDNPLYDSVVVNSDAVESCCSEQDANYEEIKENVDDESDADSEGYLKVSKGRLSLDGSDDEIYDKIR